MKIQIFKIVLALLIFVCLTNLSSCTTTTTETESKIIHRVYGGYLRPHSIVYMRRNYPRFVRFRRPYPRFVRMRRPYPRFVHMRRPYPGYVHMRPHYIW